MPKFIVKRREFIEHRQTMYGRRASWGKWRTLGSFDRATDAADRRLQETTGLHQTVVFFSGRIVIDWRGGHGPATAKLMREERG